MPLGRTPPASIPTSGSFLGRHGRLSSPRAVQSGTSAGTTGRWGDPVGSLWVDLELRPDETADVALVLGAADSEQQADDLIRRYCDPSAIRAAARFAAGKACTSVIGGDQEP